MNKSVIELAKEAGGWEVDGKTAFYSEELERFAALVREAELARIKSEREWVDLTDAEFYETVSKDDGKTWIDAVRAVIAAFKEKNCGN